MIVGLVPHLAGVVVPRTIAGLLSAIPYTVASGSTEDLFDIRERIWVVFGWTVASNCGLIIGPIMGTHIIAALGWYVLLHPHATGEWVCCFNTEQEMDLLHLRDHHRCPHRIPLYYPRISTILSIVPESGGHPS